MRAVAEHLQGRATRLAAVAAALAAGVLATSLSLPANAEAARCAHRSAAPGEVSTYKLEKAIVCLINNRRANNGRVKLDRTPDLGHAASRHTRLMLRRNCYSHQCSGEPGLLGRLLDSGYLPARNPRYEETIGFHRTPRKVVADWMDSAPHRRPLMERSYRDIGVGAGRGVPIAGYSDAGILTATAIVGRRG